VVSLHKSGGNFSTRDHFLCGAAALELKDNTTAIECFRNAIADSRSSGKSGFLDETEYYLALAYIRNKDFDFALGLLRNIKDDKDHLYNKRVTARLINKVKMLKWR
jgi:tetratricopeptide (TPR) repeat protein